MNTYIDNSERVTTYKSTKRHTLKDLKIEASCNLNYNFHLTTRILQNDLGKDRINRRSISTLCFVKTSTRMTTKLSKQECGVFKSHLCWPGMIMTTEGLTENDREAFLKIHNECKTEILKDEKGRIPDRKKFFCLPLTLFIMWELIIKSKLAPAGPGHFQLQKYPPKRKLYKKNSCFTWDSNFLPVKL